MPRIAIRSLLAIVLVLAGLPAWAAADAARPWTFAVSGDSRNCGNLVMPAIAASVHRDGVAFYWHLGDLRRIRGIDEDYVRERRFSASRPGFDDYIHDAWNDFKVHQVEPFGATPFFVGIGNHETIPPKTHAGFEQEFAAMLDRAELREQRERDRTRLPKDLAGGPRAYFHWISHGVDFISLDNAVGDRLDDAQLAWFDAVVAAARRDPAVRTLVVGMHEALPHSLSDHHSMCSSNDGILSGEHVYRTLVAAERGGRHVYVLASHSHYYLEDIYATPYWKDPRHGGVVLPGWIVGTAGAARYPLPADVVPGPGARQHVYGYLEGRVARDGEIAFSYHELAKADLEASLPADYEPADATFCFDENPRLEDIGRSPASPSCMADDHEH